MKALLVAVAATALLAPLAASAQDGGGWRGRGGGERSAAAQNPGGGGQGRGGGEGRSWGGGGEGRGWGGGRQARSEQPAQAAPVQRFERTPSQAQAQRGGGGQEWRRAQGGDTGWGDRQRQPYQQDDAQRQAQAAQREAWRQRQGQAGERDDRQRQGQAGQYQRGGDQRQGQYRNGYDQRQGQYRGSDQRQGFYQGGQRYDGQRFDGQRYDGQRYDGRRDDNRYRGDAGRYQDNRRGQQWSRNWRSNSQYYGGRSFQRMRVSPFIWPRGYSSVRFSFGQRLPSVFLAPNYFVGDYFSMGLPYPPPGAEWVRVGADALLVDIYTGEILDVVQDAFYW